MTEQEYRDREAEEAMETLAAELERRLKEPVSEAVSDGLETAGLNEAVEELQRIAKGQMGISARELQQGLRNLTDRVDQMLVAGARATQVEGATKELQALRGQVTGLETRLQELEERQAAQATRMEAGLGLLLREITLLQRADKAIIDTLRQFTAAEGAEA